MDHRKGDMSKWTTEKVTKYAESAINFFLTREFSPQHARPVVFVVVPGGGEGGGNAVFGFETTARPSVRATIVRRPTPTPAPRHQQQHVTAATAAATTWKAITSKKRVSIDPTRHCISNIKEQYQKIGS
jgi:hypothetical protein